MKKAKIIGVAGASGVGKDTFYYLFKKLNPNTARLAFADPLKAECEEVLNKEFGVDVWTKNRQLKDKFRLFLVGWAETRRNLSDGQYFIDLLRKSYGEIADKYDYIIIPDVRFCEYEYDEIDFIKENGVIVYIDRILRRSTSGHLTTEYCVMPANEKERENDTKLKRHSDFQIKWPTVGDDKLDDLIDYIQPVYEEIIKL